MPFLSSWSTTDKRVLLHFSDPVLEMFARCRQAKSSDTESGGILLGTVHGSNLLITEATTPTTLDIRRRCFFERLPFEHLSIAKERWEASEGTIRYLGEWHTHPEDYPCPSGLDKSEWMTLAQRRQDGRPVLAAIVGREALHVELTSPKGTNSVMHSIW